MRRSAGAPRFAFLDNLRQRKSRAYRSLGIVARSGPPEEGDYSVALLAEQTAQLIDQRSAHEREHAGNIKAVNPKTLDFPARSEFLIVTGRVARKSERRGK
jgi:hypothetical protein